MFQRCLKDLRERFARVEIQPSKPIVPFRETAVKAPDMAAVKTQGAPRGTIKGSSSQGVVKFTIRAAPLPADILQYILENADILKKLLSDQRARQQGKTVEEDTEEADAAENYGDVVRKPTVTVDKFWDVLKEKVALIDVTLDTRLKAVKNAPSIFAEQTETVREIFARLLQLEISLQAWLQVEAKDNQPDVASPQALEEKVVQTTIVLLRTIGHTLHMLSCSGDPSQGIRDALQESLDIVFGACAST